MKNLKKLRKDQLKTIKGSGGVKELPDPDFCMYYCDGILICATCSDDFKCPDNSI